MSGELERADALNDLHRPDEAIAIAQQAAARDPGDPRPHLVMARAHVLAKRFDSAAISAQRALSLDPVSPQGARLMGVAIGGSGREPKKAIAWIHKALELDPENPRTHSYLARVESSIGHKGKALDAAQRAVALAPDDATTYATLGVVLFGDGRLLAAEQVLRHALSLDPENADALATLGEVVAARGRTDAAAELLQMAGRSDIRDETIHQDMVRYVRGAAWGLATWPVVLLIGAIGARTLGAVSLPMAQRLGWAVVLFAAAGGLLVARELRSRRFPPEVRRLISKRAFSAAGWESAGPAGFRPWWWRLLVRIPISARTLAACGFFVLVVLVGVTDEPGWESGDTTGSILTGALAAFLIGRWWQAHRKAATPWPGFED